MLNIPIITAITAMIFLIKTTVVIFKTKLIPSIDKKYTRPLVNKNALPNINIFFLSLVPSKIFIKNNNTHIAHGLKPSINPNNIDINGRENVFTFTLPTIGNLYVFLLLFLPS